MGSCFTSGRSNEDDVSNSLNMFPGVRPVVLSRLILCFWPQSLSPFLPFSEPSGIFGLMCPLTGHL